MRSIFKLPLYDCKIRIHIEPNISSKFQSLCKKLGQTVDWNVEGAVLSNNMSLYYILLDKDKLSHNLISHEIYHLTRTILEDRVIEDEETGAWLSGYLSSVIYRLINKHQLVIKYG